MITIVTINSISVKPAWPRFAHTPPHRTPDPHDLSGTRPSARGRNSRQRAVNLQPDMRASPNCSLRDCSPALLTIFRILHHRLHIGDGHGVDHRAHWRDRVIYRRRRADQARLHTSADHRTGDAEEAGFTQASDQIEAVNM